MRPHINLSISEGVLFATRPRKLFVIIYYDNIFFLINDENPFFHHYLFMATSSKISSYLELPIFTTTILVDVQVYNYGKYQRKLKLLKSNAGHGKHKRR